VGVEEPQDGDGAAVKTFSTDLLTLLSTDVPIHRIDLYTIGPCLNGSYIYATNAQLPASYGGNVYDPRAYGSWIRDDITVKIGLDSNSCKMTLYADNLNPPYFPGTSSQALMLDGVKYGLLANAPVTIQTLYNSDYLTGYEFPNTAGPTGGSLVETKFVGLVTTIEDLGLTSCTVNLQDELYLLNRKVPHRLIQATCSHTLYDVGCGLTNTSYRKAGVVEAVTDTTTNGYMFTTTEHITPTSSAGTFAQGLLTWTTGKNSGLSCTVRLYTAGASSDTIQLQKQMIFPIVAGDDFYVFEGCDHTFSRCAEFHGSTNAYIQYGGQPVVPVAEAAIG
jgi:hypothetical protein